MNKKSTQERMEDSFNRISVHRLRWLGTVNEASLKEEDSISKCVHLQCIRVVSSTNYSFKKKNIYKCNEYIVYYVEVRVKR